MEILKAIVEGIREDAPVQEVRRGLHWTAVVSRGCGLASTLDHGGCNPDTTAGREGDLSEMTALELARYGLEGDAGRASVGLAAINSLLDPPLHRYSESGGLQIVKDLGKGKNISVIGHFPDLDALAGKARHLWIIEKQPRPGDYPEQAGETFLPQSDIVVISGTTLLNRTLPGILALCRKDSVRMLLGPTTPLSEVLFDYGIDILAGSLVTDRDTVLRSVSEGASFRQIKKKGGIRLLTLIKDYPEILRRLRA